MTTALRHGTVARVLREACHVMAEPGELVACSVRGRLLDAKGRLGNRVVVGDRVTIEGAGAGAVVSAVAPRRSAFSRRAAGGRAAEQVIAANLDRVVAVGAAAAPPFRPGFVDRVLAQATHAGLHAVLVVNKTDRVGPQEVAALAVPYEEAGYPVFRVSARRGDGVEELRGACRGLRTLFVGQSGVGKSTLLNAISPGLGLKEGEVNPKTLKGRHVTTTAWLLKVPPDLEVIDTPGMRGFALWGLDAGRLASCYPEFGRLDEPCRFEGCSHRQEPGCAVRAAVAQGALREARYRSYLKLYEELCAGRGRRR